MSHLVTEKTEETHNRAFKGIWIPAAIWEHPMLSINEKVLWAEIDSLDEKKIHCTASNQYLCKFFGWNERKLQRCLLKLKSLGLITQISNNGRVRAISSNLNNIYDNFVTPEVTDSAINDKFVTPDPSNLSSPPSPPNKDNNKVDNKDSLYTLSFGKFVRLSKVEYEKLCSDHTKPVIDEFIETVNDYISSHGLKPYKDYSATIRNFIRRAKEQKENNSIPSSKNAMRPMENASILKQLEIKYERHRDFSFGRNYVEVGFGCAVDHIKISENGFLERVNNFLRKIGEPPIKT